MIIEKDAVYVLVSCIILLAREAKYHKKQRGDNKREAYPVTS
jgi:hypothetical protein